MDLLFVLDGGHLLFKSNFVKSIMDRFVVGSNHTRGKFVAIGLLNNTVFPLNLLEDQSRFDSYIKNDDLPSITVEDFLRPDVVKVTL